MQSYSSPCLGGACQAPKNRGPGSCWFHVHTPEARLRLNRPGPACSPVPDPPCLRVQGSADPARRPPPCHAMKCPAPASPSPTGYIKGAVPAGVRMHSCCKGGECLVRQGGHPGDKGQNQTHNHWERQIRGRPRKGGRGGMRNPARRAGFQVHSPPVAAAPVRSGLKKLIVSGVPACVGLWPIACNSSAAGARHWDATAGAGLCGAGTCTAVGRRQKRGLRRRS